MSDEADQARLLRSLHIPGAPLVLPGAWDVGSARAVVDADFPVVATASNAIGAALGYDDGEGDPSEEMMFVPQRLPGSTPSPPPRLWPRIRSVPMRSAALGRTGRLALIVFPPGAWPDDLRAIVAEAGALVNAGLPLERGSLDELRAIGVAWVSVGPQLYRRALDHLHADLQPLFEARK